MPLLCSFFCTAARRLQGKTGEIKVLLQNELHVFRILQGQSVYDQEEAEIIQPRVCDL